MHVKAWLSQGEGAHGAQRKIREHAAKGDVSVCKIIKTKHEKIRDNRLFICIFAVVSKKVCKLDIILIFALSNKKQQEYGTYTRTNFGNYFELHK